MPILKKGVFRVNSKIKLPDVISEIINEVDSESYFDINYVMTQILKRYPDLLFKYLNKMPSNDDIIASISDSVEKEISKFERLNLRKTDMKSYSEDIRGDRKSCNVWFKI